MPPSLISHTTLSLVALRDQNNVCEDTSIRPLFKERKKKTDFAAG